MDNVLVDRGTMAYGNNYRTDALRVPGGIIYRTIVNAERSEAASVHSSMIFVPDVEKP